MSLLRKSRVSFVFGLGLLLLTANAIDAQHNYDFIGLDPQQPTVWTIAANWNCLDPGMGGCLYPTTGDNASIGRRNMQGVYTVFSVRATATQAVQNLTIFNASTLNFTNFTSGGTVNIGDLPSSTATLSSIASPGAYNNNGTMNITGLAGGPFNTFSGAFTFFNNGTVNMGRLLISGPITLVNQPTGVFFIGDGTLTASGSAYTFNNLGFFHKPSSPGTAFIINGTFINGGAVSNQTGTVDVGSGTLMLGASGSPLSITSNCARWQTLTAGAAFVFAGPLTVNPCTINNSPSFSTNTNSSFFRPTFVTETLTSLGGPGLITLSRNNVSLTANSTLQAGLPGLPTHVRLDMLSLDGAGNFQAFSDGTNATVLDWTHGGIAGSGRFDITPGATFNINLDSDTNIGERTFNNSGLIIWNSGNIGSTNTTAAIINNLQGGVFELRSNNTMFIGNPSIIINNAGLFRKAAGDGVSQIGGILNNSGGVEVQAGAIRLHEGTSTGVFNIGPNTVLDFLTGSTGYNFNAGTSFTGNGIALIRGLVNFNTNVNAVNVQLMNGTLNGPGDLNITGFFNCDSGTLGGTGALNILSLATLNFPANAGCNANRRINLSGSGNVPDGSVVTFDNGAVFNIQPGGVINATGGNSSFSGGDLNSSGSIILGSLLRTSVLTVRNIVARARSTNNLRAIGKALHDYSQLKVQGNATLGGTLSWDLAPGFVPNIGDSFQVVNYVTHDGVFDHINGLNFGGGRLFIPSYLPNGVTLTMTAINNSQSGPSFNSISNSPSGDSTTITGTFKATQNTPYTISIFADFPNSQAPNSLFPQTTCDTSSGGTLVGMTTVTTDGSGNANFTVTISPALSLSQIISAIASDNNNNSSKFSQCVQVGSQMQLDAATYMVSEGDGAATINVTRSGNTLGTTTIDFATSDGTAQQRTRYTVATGTLTFGPGETTRSFQVLVTDNVYVDGPQTVNITLSNPTGTSMLGSPGAATLTITDNDSSPPTTNPLDNADARFFVRQHYYDFLNRLPDQSGFDFWAGQITQCGSDQACLRTKRVDVSNAFFYELEFQQTGAYVYRLYREAFGNNQPFPNPDTSNVAEARKLPNYGAFVADRARVVGGTNLAQSQLALATAFAQRPEFLAKYPASLDGPSFVDALLATIKIDLGVDLTAQRSALITLFNSGGRGNVVYRLADDNVTTNPIDNRAFIDAEYNRAFVATQYFGYLRRDSDIGGFLFWLGQVNSAPLRNVPKQHAMVCSFITSAEYQQRFSSIVTHSNGECPQ